MLKKTFAILLSTLTVSSLSAAQTLPSSSIETSPLPSVDHVLIVEFENMDYSKVIAEPTFAAIAEAGVNFTQFFAETHPSQPNYIAMIAGDMYGVKTDKNVNLDGRHIGDLLEEAGKTWKVYADDYPGNCFLGAKSGHYVRKHVPFLSFKNVQSDPERCARIVNGKELKADIKDDALPNYSLYIPNMLDDGHDTDAAYAGRWVKTKFLPMIENLPPSTLVVFTFDESAFTSKINQIYTVFYGDVVKPGTSYSLKTDHYGFLHTIEGILGLGDLGKFDSTSPVISGVWKD